MRKISFVLIVLILSSIGVSAAQPQAEAPQPPPLFFRENWNDRPKGAPEGDLQMTQEYVSAPNMELKLYGATAKNIDPAVTALPTGRLTYIWTGVVEGNWILMLRNKTNNVDLTGLAKMRWRTRQRGFHLLRPVVKLADGTMLAADYAEPTSVDWRETEFFFADVVRWRVLDPEQAVESRDSAWRHNVDLSKVEEIGFTDLSRGGGHGQGGSSAVDWFEVYGKPVKR
jgi:hypothetical protein